MTDDEQYLIAEGNFETVCRDGQLLFARKNRQYGNAIRHTGVLGAVVEIIGAAARLPAMVLRNTTHGRDIQAKLIDVLLDIHNYASIAIMMLHDDNWEGEE
jgi:hypothetical protein